MHASPTKITDLAVSAVRSPLNFVATPRRKGAKKKVQRKTFARGLVNTFELSISSFSFFTHILQEAAPRLR
ncbi:hypothetical protein [Nostoc sp. CCY 9925]|uniref:hypothetical protein n=1 Tax=Nostoc sp. CCY 9925 TaxID=3103865 RepID=UPI0039C73ADF